MKRETKEIKCENCSETIGWMIPTGECKHGARRYRTVLTEDCRVFDAGLFRHYRCKVCAKDWGYDA